MSTNDFAKHAGSKTGYPAKLRAKHLRELRLETVQLELENQEMEQKLMQLRQSMSKEKEERERSNGCHWKSGQAASVSNQNQARFQNKENSGKASSGKFKLKILRDQTPESAKQPVMSKTAKGSACERPKMKGKACGQCEIKNALLVCLECGEDYCTGCYAKFHQKGALKLHRTIPFQAKTQVPIGKLDVAQQFKKDVNPNKSSVKHELKEINKRPFSRNSFSSVIEQSVGTEAVSSPSSRMESRNESGLQLNGAFDEEESAESFKEILIEWRKGDQGHKERKHSLESEPESIENSEVQTILTVDRKTVDIEFKENSLTYLEKLLLKKHRRTSVAHMPIIHHQAEFKCSHSFLDALHDGLDGEDDDLTAEEIEAHEQYAALFRTEESGKDLEKPESSLKIVELDDVCEQELEESRMFMVEETDCSDTDINQRNSPLIQNRTSTVWSGGKSESTPVQPNSTRQLSTHSSFSVEIQDFPPGCHDISTMSLEAIVNASCKMSTDTVNHSFETSSENIRHSLEESCSHDNLRLDTSASENSLTELQEIALRDKKSTVSRYHGLEGFFVIGTDPENARPGSFHPQKSNLSISDKEISFAAVGEWRPNSSLSENADDLIVQHILSDALNRCSESLGPQNLNNEYADLTTVHKTAVGHNPLRCLSANSRRGSINSPGPQPKTAVTRPLSRAASEISEIESIDVAEQDNSLLNEDADGQTLASLEKELNILIFHADSQKNLCSLTSADLSDYSRCMKKKSETITKVSEQPGFKDHIGAITEGSSDEECVREKYETLWDKESVKSLQ